MNPILLDLLKKTLVTGIVSGCVYLFFESPVTASPAPEPDNPPLGGHPPRAEPEPYNLRPRPAKRGGDNPPHAEQGWSNARGVEKITHREELQLILMDDTEEENPNLIYPPLRKQN
tara:strand:+ start:325 stop:672 length:348 start_codon:yes stop_codon:yes gene_type:complete